MRQQAVKLDIEVRNGRIEKALMQWFGQLRSRGAVLTDKLLLEKAKALAVLLEIADFKGSDGWLAKFKKRCHIQLHQPHGESGAADMAGVALAKTAVGNQSRQQNITAFFSSN